MLLQGGTGRGSELEALKLEGEGFCVTGTNMGMAEGAVAYEAPTV